MDFEKYYDRASRWLISIGPRVLIAIIIFIVGLWLIRILKSWINRRMTAREFDASLQPFLASLIVTVLQVLLILGIMQILGIQMTIFAALVGAIGVAAGLALSGTMQNFASGVLILLLKPFRVGDSIIAQGKEGIVRSIQIFYTVVTTYENTTVIIPNSKLSNEVIVNLSREGVRRMDIELKFNYGFSFDQIKDIILTRNALTPEILKDPLPRIGVSSVDPDGFKIMINNWVHAHGFQDVKLHYQEGLMKDLKSADIKLPGM